MLSNRTEDALDGIRLNVEAIAEFIENMTFEEFSNDRRTFYAVTRALEIISEASRRLPDDLKARYPAVRWRAIQDAGNVYRHTYSKVSKADVSDTACTQLEGLKEIVALELYGTDRPETAVLRTNNEDEGSKE